MALDDDRWSPPPANRGVPDRVRAIGTRAAAVAKSGWSRLEGLATGAQAAANKASLKLKSRAFHTRLPKWSRPAYIRLAKAHRAWSPVRNVIANVTYRPVIAFIESSLLRRILASNLLGFSILVGGFLYLNQSSTVLIDSKRRELEVQAEMIAAAIASGAKVRSDNIIIDPDKLPLAPDTQFPMRDDRFTRHELVLAPETVGPILQRMVRVTKARARVLDRDGRTVVDTETMLTPGQITLSADRNGPPAKSEKTKNAWTRIIEFMIGRRYEVYRELEGSRGTVYPEVNRALSDGRNRALIFLTDDGEQVVSAIVPIRRTQAVQGVVMLSSQDGEISEILRANRNAIIPLALVALLASVVTSLFLARTVAGPMRRLSETAELVSRDINAGKHLPSFNDRTDEVRQMAEALKDMTAALYRRIAASEKFAADVAHELKNPLTAASATAQALAYAKTPEQRDELVEQIQSELKRLNRLITDVSQASRLDAELARQSREPVRLVELFDSVVQVVSVKADEAKCTLRQDIVPANQPEVFTIRGNAGRLAQVLINIADNAISYAPAGSSVTLHMRRHGQIIRIAIEDEGGGIEDDKLETIFDRFYTYRPTETASRGDNSGLGLNISQEIVHAHGGRIWAENRYAAATGDGERQRIGARFVIELPDRDRGGHRGGPSNARHT